MRKLFLLFISLTIAAVSYAQVGINTTTPHASSMLDVESTSKGVLIPQMTTSQKAGIANPAPGLLVYDITTKCLSQNVAPEGSAVGSWICLSQKDTQSSFFYMPSVSIDASKKVTNQDLDLYKTYKDQFFGPAAKSDGAPISIPFFPLNTQLYYYITKFDASVIKINSLSATGVLNYDIVNTSTYDSFMNVVFVIKP